MAQVTSSNVRYAGTATLTNIWSLLASDSERTTFLRSIAQKAGLAVSATAINSVLTYNSRVVADGGSIVDPLSCLKAFDWIADNSVALASTLDASPAWGVKTSGGKITKLYDIGSTNNDYILWAGSGATPVSVSGHSMMAFDGASAYRTTNALGFTPYPFAFGGVASAAAAQVAIISESNVALTTDAGTQTGSVLTSRSSQMRSAAGGNVQINASTTADYLGLVNYQLVTGAGTSNLYQDGVLAGTAGGADRTYASGRYLYLGVLLDSGTPAAKYYSTGNLAEAWFMNNTTTTLAASLSTHLGAKY